MMGKESLRVPSPAWRLPSSKQGRQGQPLEQGETILV